MKPADPPKNGDEAVLGEVTLLLCAPDLGACRCNCPCMPVPRSSLSELRACLMAGETALEPVPDCDDVGGRDVEGPRCAMSSSSTSPTSGRNPGDDCPFGKGDRLPLTDTRRVLELPVVLSACFGEMFVAPPARVAAVPTLPLGMTGAGMRVDEAAAPVALLPPSEELLMDVLRRLAVLVAGLPIPRPVRPAFSAVAVESPGTFAAMASRKLLLLDL